MKESACQGQERSGQMTIAKGVLGEHPVVGAILMNRSNSNSDNKTFYKAEVEFVEDKDELS